MAETTSSSMGVVGSAAGTALQDLLMADDIQPGTDASYQLCKTIYLYHPLGQKMVDAPITMAQSQARTQVVQDAPEEVVKELVAEQHRMNQNAHIHNAASVSRIYGLSAVVAGCKGQPTDKPLDMKKIWQQDLFFNVLDPLNTAGSLVLSQIPGTEGFNNPVNVRTNGEDYHFSRYRVLMNESPVYIAYTTSAFGFVGRSVYQRALYPLKSFIRSMIADDLIETKLALLIAKQEQPASVIDAFMSKVVGLKNAILKKAQSGQVLSIGITEEIETLNMQNVDGAGNFARTNILKNTATAADMPAQLLENETMVAGFGEGTEDAKNIARLIDHFREKLAPIYAWFDNFAQHRAWSPPFFERMQVKYPEIYGNREYDEVFSEWRASYSSEWPSLLIEPESEQIKVEAVKLEALVAIVQTLLPQVDPQNKGVLIQWLSDNAGENKRLFAHELNLDIDELVDFSLAEHERNSENEDNQANGAADKLGRFDSTKTFSRLRAALDELREKRVTGAARRAQPKPTQQTAHA